MLFTLHIKLLGGFSLSCAGKSVVGVTTERLKALLAYLVLHRDIPQTRQRLAFQFWADSTEAQARTNLRRELHHLRQGLPDADRFLLADAKTLQWNPHAPFVLDVAEFERACATAEAAERAGDISGARTAWEQSIQLYGGDLLPCCEDEWIFSEREHLRQKLLHALESLTRLSEAGGDYRAAIRSAQRLLEIEPLHEASYLALMRSHHLNGDRASALQVYHRCMTVLREELGVDPSAIARKLYEQLLVEDDAAPEIQPSVQSTSGAAGASPLQISRPGAGAPPLQARVFSSPVALSPLVGRDRERAAIQEWATSILLGNSDAKGGIPSVLSIAGEPGIGKTRLLEELRSMLQSVQVLWGRGFAAEMMRPYGIWIDALRSLPMPSKIPPELAVLLPELDRSTQSAPDPPPLHLRERSQLFDAVVQQLAAASDRAPVMVILDDIQWLDEASSALLHYAIRLLSHSPVRFACTWRSGDLEENPAVGRVVQALRRERRLQTLELHPLDREQTAQLIRSVPALDRVDLSLEIVNRLFTDSGGNPLFALEVARALSQDRSASGQDLEAAIADRLQLLDRSAREFLPWAAALGRSFKPAAVAHAADYPLPQLLGAIAQLEQQTIIRPSAGLGDGISYDFAHDIVRQTVYHQLSAPRRRLIHLQIARKLHELPTPDSASAGDIARHAALGGDRALAAEAALSAAQRCLKLFAYTEASELAQLGIEQCQGLDDRARIPLHSGLLRICAIAGSAGDRAIELETECQRLADEAHQLGLQDAEAIALEGLAILYFDRSNFRALHQQLLRSVELSLAASPATAARLLAGSGSCLAEIGSEMTRAEALLLEAQSLAARVGLELCDIYSGLGSIHLHNGRYAEARTLLQQAWRLTQADRNYWRECTYLSYLAMLELEAGAPAAALPYCEAMAIVSANIEGEGSEGAIATALAALANYSLRLPAADTALLGAIATLQQVDAKRMLSYVLIGAAQVDLERDRPDLAKVRAATALEAASIVQHPSEIAWAWSILIQSALASGDVEGAIVQFAARRDSLDRPALSCKARNAVDRAIEQMQKIIE